jgi:hypothetical protein
MKIRAVLNMVIALKKTHRKTTGTRLLSLPYLDLLVSK